jgi:hypothetical protein
MRDTPRFLLPTYVYMYSSFNFSVLVLASRFSGSLFAVEEIQRTSD